MDAEWIEFLIKLGSIAGAITGVSKLAISMYNKTVTEPQNRIIQQVQADNAKHLAESINPLTRAIDGLNHLLADSQRDRQNLHKKTDKNASRLDKHGERIEEHETRITVLEDRCR